MERARMLGIGLCLFTGCMGSPELGTDASSPAPLWVQLQDLRGEPSQRAAAPRRPVLAIAAGERVLGQPEALLLLPGLGDDALLDDLAGAPLRAATLGSSVPLYFRPTAAGVTLMPLSVLAPDSDYTLAIARWAQAESGRALVDAPRLWPFRTASDARAGARVVASIPPDGSVDIGTNLARAVLAFDGEVVEAERGVWLEGPDGLAVDCEVQGGPCSELAPEFAAAHCVVLLPRHGLAPSHSHALVVGAAARDRHGAPAGPFRSSFVTASAPDDRPPGLLSNPCALDEDVLPVGCALVDDDSIAVRVLAGEPVTATLSGAGHFVGAVAPAGQALLELRGLAADQAVTLELELRDACDNRVTHSLQLRTHPALPQVSIVELRANPLGPEPRQEFVEILNYGDSAVPLRGLSLDDQPDRRSQPIERDLDLPPGARALLVADAYDPADPRDVQPPPGAILLRVGTSLGTSGLANAGEAVFLRDGEDRRLSAAPASPAPRAGVCRIRVGTDPRDGSPQSFDYDPEGSCTPGR